MDDQSNVYSEKKLATYETTYKESILSKPQDISLTITAAHLYGLAFICEQKGTKEGDPEYTRFVCGYEEITKIYINNNNRNSPIYVQCDDTSKGVMNRRRIILPCFAKNEEIIKIIESAKADFDKKNAGKQKHPVKTDAEKAQERERLKKAADEEFENLTAGYKKPESKPQEAAPKDDFTVADILGLDDITVTTEEKTEPEKEVKPETAKETPSDDFFEELVIPDVADLPDAESVEDPGDMPDESFAEIKLEDVDTEKITEPEIVSEAKPEPAAMVKEEPVVHETVHKSEFSSGGMYAKSMYASAEKEEPKPAEPKKKAEPEKKPEPAAAPKPEKKAEAVKPDISEGKMSLEEFQTAVKKLKAMRDENVLTEEEFAAEKSRLLQFLY